MEFGSPQFWLAALEIVAINVLLSGDNAVVIALACRDLPGRQRRWGVIFGALGAIVLRIVLTFFAIGLLRLPYLKVLGGLALFGIGIRLVAGGNGEGGAPDVKASGKLLAAIGTVVVADLVMSVDNVLGVAAAARDSLALIVFGLVVSIPLVVVGSQVIMKLLERFPFLVIAGGGLLGYVAGEMVVEDVAVGPWIEAHAHPLSWIVPVVGILVVVVVAQWLQRRQSAPDGS